MHAAQVHAGIDGQGGTGAHAGGTPILQCGGCDKRFASGEYDAQLRHEHQFHPELFIECEHVGCGYTTKLPANLEKHRRRYHFQESGVLYDCSGCPSSFTTLHHLTVHTQETHNRGWPFWCDVSASQSDLDKKLIKQRMVLALQTRISLFQNL